MSTNNCRLENIRESKLYSPILKNGGRCVVVVEGFYEWQTTAGSSKTKHKQPFYIYASQEGNVEMDNPETWNNKYDPDKGWSGIKLLYMAGLYNIWQSDDKVVYSYAVITMESNKTLSWLHHRMPAILSQEEQIEAWLDIENVSTEMALAVLKPIEVLSWHKVSSLVNKSKNKSNNCIKKLPQQVTRNKCTQQTLNAWFTKCEKRKRDEPTTSEQKKVKK